jgi:phosphatidylinositol alpha-mannosyltransferase
MIKKVGLVSPYALSVPGGVQEQVLSMSRELSKRSVEVVVLAPDSSDVTHYETPAEVVRLGPLTSLPANGSKAPLTLSWSAAKQAREVLRGFAPDIVHYHEPFAPLLGWPSLLSHEFASVGTIHRSGGGPAIRLTGPLLRRLARKLNQVVAVSEMAAVTYANSLASKPTVLFNGFEIERFREMPRVKPMEPTLVVVGRLEERKGVATAVEAIRRHNKVAESKWCLRIVGDGPERARLESLAQGDTRINFLGRVSDEQKREELRTASALVAPALYGESFGLILIEGLASQTPVIASNIDGYRQAGGGLVTLFEPGNSDDLLGAIQRAVDGDSLAGQEPVNEYVQRWSMMSLIDEYLEIYEQATRDFQAV